MTLLTFLFSLLDTLEEGLGWFVRVFFYAEIFVFIYITLAVVLALINIFKDRSSGA